MAAWSPGYMAPDVKKTTGDWKAAALPQLTAGGHRAPAPAPAPAPDPQPSLRPPGPGRGCVYPPVHRHLRAHDAGADRYAIYQSLFTSKLIGGTAFSGFANYHTYNIIQSVGFWFARPFELLHNLSLLKQLGSTQQSWTAAVTLDWLASLPAPT